MRPLRALLVLLLIAGGLAASGLLIAHELGSLRHSGFFRLPATGLLPQPTAPLPVRTPRQSRRTSTQRSAPRIPARRRPDPPPPPRRPNPHAAGLLHPGWLTLLLIVAAEIAAGAVLVAVLLVALVGRRLRMRSQREYALYELHLSMHDQAKPQDLEDTVEAIANIVRAFPTERARRGQPHVALELICGEGQQGLEWSINVRCEPSASRALDAAFSAAYPDVRLGRRHADMPLPRMGSLLVPGYVMRFRKERSFVYPLLAAGDELASPPLEQIARAQVALAAPSIVRFQLTPTPSFFEEYARRRYRRHENKLVRQERWGLPEGGLWSTLNRAEMRNAQRTQNRSLFWLETVIAADTMQSCKTVAAAVQSRRGENRLHRRWMIVRQNLYRRRFPRALGPLLPTTRSLVSAAEVAHLLALPTARMKGVPVRRVTLPRIPAPPEAMRACRVRRSTPQRSNSGAGRRVTDRARVTEQAVEVRVVDAGGAG
jgi:hypothetical protein